MLINNSGISQCGFEIPDEILQEIVRLSVRYVKDRFLPDKAIDLMDEAASRLSLDSSASIFSRNQTCFCPMFFHIYPKACR